MLLIAPAFSMRMPAVLLPLIMFREATVVPPMVLLLAVLLIKTPNVFGMAASPRLLVPTRLPATVLPVAPAPPIQTPGPTWPEMTLPAPATEPPIVTW